VLPDLITTAKGIAGGMPLAAVTGRAEVMDSIHTSGLGGTYGGNPVSCAAALGAIATMREQDLRTRARDIERLFLERLESLRSKYDVIADVRGRGAMLAIELTDGTPALTPDPTLTASINKYCHSQGLVTLTCGTHGNVFRFLPPLASPDHLLREGLDILDEAFATVVGG
jgi:4-aminobutyrate aminotransferase/(S)-3-amino-2-methylpropionate transaminase